MFCCLRVDIYINHFVGENIQNVNPRWVRSYQFLKLCDNPLVSNIAFLKKIFPYFLTFHFTNKPYHFPLFVSLLNEIKTYICTNYLNTSIEWPTNRSYNSFIYDYLRGCQEYRKMRPSMFFFPKNMCLKQFQKITTN